MDTYQHYDDYDIVSILEQGDKFKGYRVVNKEEKEVTYTIGRTPVHFGHSNNWAVRVHSRGLNAFIGLPETENLTETVDINKDCMNRYRFNTNHVNFHRQQKQIKKATKHHE